MPRTVELNGEKFNLGKPKERINYWNLFAQKKLLGKKITEVRYVDDEEFKHVLSFIVEGADEKPIEVFVMSDDEGNNTGALHCSDGDILPRIR